MASSSVSDGPALTAADARVLALFERPGAVETPTPGVRAWLARDPSEGQRPVLIKRIAAAGGAGKARATEALALRHPSVVPTRRWLFEGGAAAGGALYVVRDVIRGRNLKQALAGGGGGESAVTEPLRTLLLPVIEVLEQAHGMGMAHGGISAENILVGDDGSVFLSDFATADPSAPQHAPNYAGSATAAGDILALRRLIGKYLPRTGTFANPVVRGRIEGIVQRCDSLADLRTTLLALERLAAAPVPRAPGGSAPPVVGRGTPPPAVVRPPVSAGGAPPVVAPPERPPVPAPPRIRSTSPPLSPGERTGEFAPAGEAHSAAETASTLKPMGPPGGKAGGDVAPPAEAVPTSAAPGAPPRYTVAGPRLVCQAPERPVRAAQGGGTATSLTLRNEGQTPLIVRMIATQHAWLNVRPVELPLSIPPGGGASVGLAVSAARLTPGDYRSEVYLSANAPGPGAEDLRGGWFKHTAEIRLAVDPPGAGPMAPW